MVNNITLRMDGSLNAVFSNDCYGDHVWTYLSLRKVAAGKPWGSIIALTFSFDYSSINNVLSSPVHNNDRVVSNGNLRKNTFWSTDVHETWSRWVWDGHVEGERNWPKMGQAPKRNVQVGSPCISGRYLHAPWRSCLARHPRLKHITSLRYSTKIEMFKEELDEIEGSWRKHTCQDCSQGTCRNNITRKPP